MTDQDWLRVYNRFQKNYWNHHKMVWLLMAIINAMPKAHNPQGVWRKSLIFRNLYPERDEIINPIKKLIKPDATKHMTKAWPCTGCKIIKVPAGAKLTLSLPRTSFSFSLIWTLFMVIVGAGNFAKQRNSFKFHSLWALKAVELYSYLDYRFILQS